MVKYDIGILDSFLCLALKKQITELKAMIKERNPRVDKINELETELKVYEEELLRMRAVLEEVMRSKDPLANPEKVKQIEKEFKQQNTLLSNVQKENQDLCQILKSKDRTIEEQATAIKEKDAKIEKLRILVKDSK